MGALEGRAHRDFFKVQKHKKYIDNKRWYGDLHMAYNYLAFLHT